MNQSPNSLEEMVIENDLLLEQLDPIMVQRAVKGRTLLMQFATESKSFILNQPYDEVNDLERYIRRCDKVLEDIEAEKRIASGERNSQYKFALYYIWNISKTIFTSIILPLMVTNPNTRIPTAVIKLFLNNSPETWSNLKRAGVVTINGILGVTTMPSDFKGLYLTFADYNRLLDCYEREIKETKAGLIRKQNAVILKDKEKSRMYELKEVAEFEVDPVLRVKPDEVNYQMPKDLEVPGNPTPDVVHDDDQTQQMNNVPEVDPPENGPLQNSEEVPPAEFTPIDAINQAKSDPLAVQIAKYNGNHYIDHHDLQCYMDASGQKDYESALQQIIDAHKDTELKLENTVVIMGEADMENISDEIKSQMEDTSVKFEVYKSQ